MDIRDDRRIRRFLLQVIDNAYIHKKWLNTLSYLENCGARNLSKFEHPTKVKKEMLKHASEEFRHAHLLKWQMERLGSPIFIDYRIDYLLGNMAAYHYMKKLEVGITRLAREALLRPLVKEGIYLLMTWAIEKRALFLYPLYEKILREKKSPIRMQSLIKEEIEHFAEISGEISALQLPNALLKRAEKIEAALFERLLSAALSFEFAHEPFP